MAFIGEVDGQKLTIDCDLLNGKIESLLKASYRGKVSLYDLFVKNNTLENFVRLLLVEEDVIDEYLHILDLLLRKGNDDFLSIRWKYFEIKVANTYSNEQTFGLRSIRPDGFLTNLVPSGDFENDGGIYIDIYTVPQIYHQKTIGIQALLPIVNVRRNYYIKNKKESELSVFHSLLVDMKNNAPSLLNEILTHDTNLSNNARITVTSARDYINNIINQASRVLDIFSNYAYSDYVFKGVNINKLEFPIQKQISNFKDQLAISYTIDKKLSLVSTLLIPDVLEYFLDQLIKNALKEYERLELPHEQREINIQLTKINLRNKDAMKVSISSKNTSIDSKILIQQAGKRPLQSSTSTGLGFYFLNTLLELMKATLPENNKERYFDLISEKEGVLFEFYYNQISSNEKE
tara:strand:+ start:741891 stop:743105 length:1215 start_codon:yes stop_codon:yes gene_type:complete